MDLPAGKTDDMGDGRKFRDPNHMNFSDRNCNYPQLKYGLRHVVRRQDTQRLTLLERGIHSAHPGTDRLRGPSLPALQTAH